MSEVSTCCTCGFEWKAGQHGGHCCGDVLVEKLEQAKQLERINIDSIAGLEKQLEQANDRLAVSKKLALIFRQHLTSTCRITPAYRDLISKVLSNGG